MRRPPLRGSSQGQKTETKSGNRSDSSKPPNKVGADDEEALARGLKKIVPAKKNETTPRD
jgi:hypothetical protein